MAQIIVTTASDVVDEEDGVTSLREALILANSNEDADEITFDVSLNGETVVLTNGPLAITQDLSINGDIDGDGIADITLDADAQSGVLQITGSEDEIPLEEPLVVTLEENAEAEIDTVGDFTSASISVSLHGLNITGGYAVNEKYSVPVQLEAGEGGELIAQNSYLPELPRDDRGSGINAREADVKITNSTISDNAGLGAGGILVSGGSLQLVNVSVADNSATQDIVGSGGISAYASDVSIVSSTISGNTTSSYINSAGGIHFTGGRGGRQESATNSLEIIGSTIHGNSGRSEGGVGFKYGDVTVNQSTITANTAKYSGGGIGSKYGASDFSVINSIVVGNLLESLEADQDQANISVGRGEIRAVEAGPALSEEQESVLEENDGIVGSIVSGDVEDVFADIDEEGNAILQDNGGLVETVSINAFSAATGIADDSFLVPDLADADGDGDTEELLPLDANGNLRQVGNLDAGAVEAQFDTTNVVVDSLDDTVDGDLSDGQLTLREALEIVDDGGSITFAEALSGQTITLDGEDLVIDKSVSIDGDIDGDDKADITISGNDESRIFRIVDAEEEGEGETPVILELQQEVSLEGADGNNVVLESLTLTQGSSEPQQGEGPSGQFGGIGGAILVNQAGSLTIRDTTISDSSAKYAGGALGVYQGDVSVVNSLLVDNNAGYVGGGVFATSYGGEKYGAGPLNLDVTNTTIHGNTAGATGAGIALFTDEGASATISNSNVTDNVIDSGKYGSQRSAGAGISTNSSNLTLLNSVIAGNVLTVVVAEESNEEVPFVALAAEGENSVSEQEEAPATEQVADDILGEVTFASNNFFGSEVDVLVGENNLTSDDGDPGLDALADNGGSVLTQALLDGSILIDAGNSSLLPDDVFDLDGDGDFAEALSRDAKGGARENGESVDIGAFEAILERSGGAEDDVIEGNDGDEVNFSNAGDDTFNGQGGRDIHVNAAGNDTFSGGDDDDIAVAFSGNNNFDGDNGQDILLGGIGDDDLDGGDGDDFLVGDAVSQFYFGNDTLTGGDGDDDLMGAGGADVFVFDTDDGNDVIAAFDLVTRDITGPDFVSGVDKISLQGFGYENGDAALANVSDVDGVAVFNDTNFATTITFHGLTTDDLSATDFIF